MQILVIANSKYFHPNYTFIFKFSKKKHLFIWSKITYEKDHTLEQRVKQVKLFTVKSRLVGRKAANNGNNASYSAQING